jgi:hypothetical protein
MESPFSSQMFFLRFLFHIPPLLLLEITTIACRPGSRLVFPRRNRSRSRSVLHHWPHHGPGHRLALRLFRLLLLSPSLISISHRPLLRTHNMSASFTISCTAEVPLLSTHVTSSVTSSLPSEVVSHSTSARSYDSRAHTGGCRRRTNDPLSFCPSTKCSLYSEMTKKGSRHCPPVTSSVSACSS